MTALILFVLISAARAFFELSRTALINIKKVRLVELEKQNPAMAKAINELTDDSTRLLATAEVGTMLSVVFATGVAVLGFSQPLANWLIDLAPQVTLLGEWGLQVAQFMVLAIAALVLFVLGRLVPQAVAIRNAEPVALACVTPMQICAILFAPLVKFAVLLGNIFSSPFGVPPQNMAAMVTQEEIKTMVDASQEGGEIEAEEKEMILSVLDFGDTIAREVMVPRMDIIGFDVTESIDQALDTVVNSGHSRLPVYRDTVDDIIGVLYTKDLLRVLRDNTRPSLQSLVRAVLHTPESKPVSDLLKEMQSKRLHLAVIVDEFGGTSGIVTIEDILEEIVGEIQDEYDSEEAPVTVLPDDAGFVLFAGMQIDDVNEVLGTHINSDQSDTLGGFIFDQLGEVPKVGAKVDYDDKLFEVLSVSDRRILKVKVTPKVSTDLPKLEHQTEPELHLAT